MTNQISLYSGPLSMFGMKAHIAALEKNLNIKLIQVAFSEEHGYFPKHDEVKRINPKQQVPVLCHGDLELFDSTQIFEYLEDLQPQPALWPNNITSRARARLLELKADEVYFPHVVKLMGLQDDLLQPDAQSALASCASYCTEMEQQLADQPFLLDKLSFADIGFFMTQLFAERMGARMTHETPKLMAWRSRMLSRQSVQTALKPMVKHLRQVNRPVPEFLNS